MFNVANIFFKQNIKGCDFDSINGQIMKGWGLQEGDIQKFKLAYHTLQQNPSFNSSEQSV